jgi:catechol 2,3-dioxygenase-like lactoylglutathione lyase family enzyme
MSHGVDTLPKSSEQRDMQMTQLGYTIFYVDDVAATLGFFHDAFGLVQKFLAPEDAYGELDTGATTLAFASTALASSNLGDAGGFTPLHPTDPPVGASITLIAEDVEAAMETALEAGGTPYVEPATKPWGQTVAYIRDPNGNLVEIATAMPS